MKILTTASVQSIKFIPRHLVSSVVLTLTDKNTRTSTNVGVSVVNSNGYMILTGSFDLKEGTNYSMEVSTFVQDFENRLILDGGSLESLGCITEPILKKVIYRDTIFCTDQTDYNKFDVHKNEYVTEDTFDNEFIVL
jgi:hypothetical protein